MNNICSTLLHSSLCPHRRPHRFLLRLEGDSMRPLPPNLERARGGRMSSTTQRIHLNRVWKRSRRMQAALELDATPLEFPKLVPFRLQDKALQHKPEALHACRHPPKPPSLSSQRHGLKGSKWELKSGYGMSYCMERSRAKPLGPFQNQRPSGRPMKLSKTTSSQMRTSACGQQDNGLTSGAQHTVLRGRNAVRLSWCLAR